MKLHELSPAPGSTKKAYRVGRGAGSGNGKTAGKGHKAKESAIVNVSDLEAFENGTVVTEQLLVESGLVKKALDGVKVLGNGELSKNLTVNATAFSASVKEKIEKAGGKAEVI